MSLSSNEFLKAMQAKPESETARLASVVSVATGADGVKRAKVKFYGETEASSLDIPIMETGTPSSGDVAVVQKVGTSLVIIGKLKAV